MKNILIIFLMTIFSVRAFSQSRQWIYSPGYKMISLTGAITTFPAASDITNCTNFSNNREGVYSNPSSGEYVAFNRCGFFDAAGDQKYAYGSDNFLGVPGQCNKYFSLRWEMDGPIHNNIDMLVLRGYEWDAALDTFTEVSKDILVNNNSRIYQKNHAVGALSTGGRRYLYAAYEDTLAIFHVSTWGNIYFDNKVKLPYPTADIGALQMEVAPDNDQLTMLLNGNRIYRYNRVTGSLTSVTSFGSNTIVSGIETVPGSTFGTPGQDRLYVSYHTNNMPYTGDIVYYNLSTLAGPISATNTLPSSLSEYECGHSEIERARDGNLYFAAYTGTPAAFPNYSLASGLLHKLNLLSGNVTATSSPTNIENNTNLNGFLIQSQVDGDDYNFECYSGCNSDFTYSYNTANTTLTVDFIAEDPSQPRQYKWTFDGTLVKYGPSVLGQPFSAGCHTVTLQIIDPSDPWNECQQTATFCLNGPATLMPADVDHPGGPCPIAPDFIIHNLSGSRIKLEPLTAGSYYYIDWGDGKDTLHSAAGFPVGGLKHFYYATNPNYPFIAFPATGTYTVCLQTGDPGMCKKCFDVYLNGFNSAIRIADPDPEKPTGIAENEASQGTKSFYIHSLSPNPAHENINVDITAKQSGMISVVLFDLTGKQLRKSVYSINEGANSLNVSLEGISNGMYFLQVSNKDGKTLNKIIKN